MTFYFVTNRLPYVPARQVDRDEKLREHVKLLTSPTPNVNCRPAVCSFELQLVRGDILYSRSVYTCLYTVTSNVDKVKQICIHLFVNSHFKLDNQDSVSHSCCGEQLYIVSFPCDCTCIPCIYMYDLYMMCQYILMITYFIHEPICSYDFIYYMYTILINAPCLI